MTISFLLQLCAAVIYPATLSGLDEVTSKPAKTRIRDAGSARALVQQVIKEDEPRGRMRALVKGMIDRNPPFPDARRKSAGMAWTANLNFGEGEAIIDLAHTPYYALLNGVENYADTCTALNYGTPEGERYNGIIAQKFHAMIGRWPHFRWHTQFSQKQMLTHGIGSVLFDREGDWRFRAVPAGMVLAPKGSQSCVDERLPFLVVRVPYRAHELYDRIEQEGPATDAGWNIEATKNAVKWAMRSTMPGSQSWWQYPWEAYQQQIKDNDLYVGYTGSDIIWCSHVLNIELGTGKISQAIVTDEPILTDEQYNKQSPDDFLFRSVNKFDSYEQAVVVFFQTIGDGSWHSVRGLATKSFAHLDCSNRLKNGVLDRAFFENSIIIQPGNMKSLDKLQVTRVGATTYLPAGVELQQIQVSGAVESAMSVDRMLTNHLANNIGMFQQRTLSREDGRGEMPTATQVNHQISKESTLSTAQIDLWFDTEDKVFAEMFRRAADSHTSDTEAKRFQKECVESGVPIEALRNMIYVRANRASGYGSPQAKSLALQQTMNIVPMLPEDGKRAWLKLSVGALLGADKVAMLVPEQHTPNQDDDIATLENGLMEMGRKPTLASGQDDVRHLQSHIQDATDKLAPMEQAIQIGEQPDAATADSAMKYISVWSPHCGEHLQRVEADPTRKQLAKLFKEQILQVVAFNGKLRGVVLDAQRQQQIAAQQQQQATALDAVTSAKVRAIETDSQVKAQKAQEDMRLKSLKTAHQLRLSDVKAAHGITISAAKTKADINLNQRKAMVMPMNGNGNS